MQHLTDLLSRISAFPNDREEFSSWLAMESAFSFLSDNELQDDFVVYASDSWSFIHTILVPATSLNERSTPDLMSWNGNASDSWSVSFTPGNPDSLAVLPPLNHTGTETLRDGEQLVFSRFFEGYTARKGYYEILQKFLHVFDLHFMEERNAYCRLNKTGDIEDVIRTLHKEATGKVIATNIVSFSREILDEYLALTNSALVRTFDFVRYHPSTFTGWSAQRDNQIRCANNFAYYLHIEPEYASHLRGVQLTYPTVTKASIIERLDPFLIKDREYATFLAHDWKNDRVIEISCAPGFSANYFTESELPFETSSVFFRPEVLLKYKADSEKYSLSERSVMCRGGWSLNTFDINDAGQVHTYLVYLRNLPFEEQIYWKSFNEKPKAGLSTRAVKTDFKGEWDLEYDPLCSLKEAFRDLHVKQVPWWKLRSASLPARIHYPVTASPDEWANEILSLDQLVVEGFDTRWLKETGLSGSPAQNATAGSLTLLSDSLVRRGVPDREAKSTVAPLRELHDLRSKMKGHAPGKDASALKKQLLRDHGSFKSHFRSLCGRCDESVRAISTVLESNLIPDNERPHFPPAQAGQE